MSDSLKRYMNNIYNILDELDEVGLGVNSYNPDLGLTQSKELVKSEILTFCLYLTASDGEIALNEKAFMDEYFNLHFSIEEIRRFIKEKNIYSIEFSETIPESVRMFVDADNQIVKAGTLDSTGNGIMYDVYRLVGQAFISCDNHVDEKEKRDLSQYLLMIKNYINDNSLSSNRVLADPFIDADAASNLLTQYKPENVEVDYVPAYLKASQDNENQAPWETTYLDHACPYCGKKKVRYAKWEDKAISTAFWGFFSYKLHCNYKCDNCKEMWT